MIFGMSLKSYDLDGLFTIYKQLDLMSLKKADKYFKKGEDNLTTGIFQWSKDFTAGASNFSEACNSSNIQWNSTTQRADMINLYWLWDSW